MGSNITLVAGCYERFLFGYSHTDLQGVEQGANVSLEKSFLYPAHQGPIKCVDTAGGLVVTGGSDDQMHLYDIRHNKDLGFLMNPGEGAVTSVKFFCPPGKAYPANFLSGSADGSVHVWKAGGGWEHMKPLRGHRGSVHHLSVHPTGLMAISVAHDRFLKLWDLVKGRCTYTAKLEAEGEIVEFGPLGTDYVLVSGKKVTIHGVDGVLRATLEHDRKVGAVVRTEAALITGAEDGRMRLWDLRAAPVRCALEVPKAHSNRIRGIALPGLADPTASVPTHIASASSDGRIRLWDTRMASTGPDPAIATPVGEVTTNARLTSLAAVNTDAVRTAYARNLQKALGVVVDEKPSDRPAPATVAPPASTSGRAAGAAAGPKGAKRAGAAAPAKAAGAKKEQAEDFAVVAREEEESEEEELGEDSEEEGSEEEEEEEAGPEIKRRRGSEREAVWGPKRGAGFADLKEQRRKQKKQQERQRKINARKKQAEEKAR